MMNLYRLVKVQVQNNLLKRYTIKLLHRGFSPVKNEINNLALAFKN